MLEEVPYVVQRQHGTTTSSWRQLRRRILVLMNDGTTAQNRACQLAMPCRLSSCLPAVNHDQTCHAAAATHEETGAMDPMQTMESFTNASRE